MDAETWLASLENTPEMLAVARTVLDEVRAGREVMKAIRRHPLSSGGYVPKHTLVTVYRQGVAAGEWPEDDSLLARIRRKPVRSLSGVTTVTVLTGPQPCPGHCIFCPQEPGMPKSYLADEPGAARAFQNRFDAFAQVRSRLDSYTAVGHPVDKVELLILGGTWDAYPPEYRQRFVQRCLDALNGSESSSLEEAQQLNETASRRNVGMVVETRPDEVTPASIRYMRRLGVTKVQLGVQSLDDAILARNCRGHDTAAVQRAFALLRAAGFKIVAHWMPNLLGATPDSDRQDFARLWLEAGRGLGICPDELKIYPTQLLAGTALYRRWQSGEYQPYDMETLVNLVADLKPSIPEYCRLNRVIRDIPSHHVVAGNRRTSLRQDISAELARRGLRCRCIRCREVRSQPVQAGELHLQDLVYRPAFAVEHFLSYVTPTDRLAGYLRLSLPAPDAPDTGLEDLAGAALVREVHVYGQSLAVGSEQEGAAQHSGLGTRLLAEAERLALQAGFLRLAVISAIGTRRYYQARGYNGGSLYMVKPLG